MPQHVGRNVTLDPRIFAKLRNDVYDLRDPLMLRFISEAYRDSVLPQFAPAVLVFREIMDALRLHYRQTPLIDFLDCLIDQSHAIARISATDRELVAKCRMKMSGWIQEFEERFAEFYLSLKAKDPFSFNLVPLAVLASVEAQFFTPESGVIPSISIWLAGPSLNRRKMALLAANWLSQDHPVKVLTTLEAAPHGNDLDDWYDWVLAGYEKHSPRLLDEFFNKMHFPTRRHTEIRALGVAPETRDVQYQCDSFLAWLFLEDQSRLRQLGIVYDMIRHRLIARILSQAITAMDQLSRCTRQIKR